MGKKGPYLWQRLRQDLCFYGAGAVQWRFFLYDLYDLYDLYVLYVLYVHPETALSFLVQG